MDWQAVVGPLNAEVGLGQGGRVLYTQRLPVRSGSGIDQGPRTGTVVVGGGCSAVHS